MKTVATFMAVHEAHFARTLLESEGIPAVVTDEHTAGTVVYAPMIGGAKLQVLDEDYGRAALVLGLASPEETAPAPEKSPAGTCPRCGASVYTSPRSPGSIIAFFAALFAAVPFPPRTARNTCPKCGVRLPAD